MLGTVLKSGETFISFFGVRIKFTFSENLVCFYQPGKNNHMTFFSHLSFLGVPSHFLNLNKSN